jgi:hypothetical protein
MSSAMDPLPVETIDNRNIVVSDLRALVKRAAGEQCADARPTCPTKLTKTSL